MTNDSNDALDPHPTTAIALDDRPWRVSSFTGYNECVALAEYGDLTAVRNSNAPDAGTLLLTREQMADWVAGIKAGEFDDLMD